MIFVRIARALLIVSCQLIIALLIWNLAKGTIVF